MFGVFLEGLSYLLSALIGPGTALGAAIGTMFFTEGGSKRTDWVTKHIFVPKGVFTPPFETAASLRARLSKMYAEVDFKTVRAEGIFVCRKSLEQSLPNDYNKTNL